MTNTRTKTFAEMTQSMQPDTIRTQMSATIAEKDAEFTRQLIEWESRFGSVSKQRKQKQPTQENTQQQTLGAGMSQGRRQGGSMPQHPLLKGQRYDGLAQQDSPLAAASNPDALFEHIAEAVEQNPELAAHPELSNDLKMRIAMYNQQKLEMAMRSRPTVTMDRRP